MEFLWQKYWSCLPFPLPVGHVLTELSTMIQPSRVALHGMAHSIIELHGHLCHDKVVIHEVEVKAGIGFLFLGSKITMDADCSHEIKTLASWKESYDKI